MAKTPPRQSTKQTATVPKADPRLRVDVSQEDRERLLGKYLAMKKAEQDYMDAVVDVRNEMKIGEGLGKVNVAYSPETGRWTVTPQA